MRRSISSSTTQPMDPMSRSASLNHKSSLTKKISRFSRWSLPASKAQSLHSPTLSDFKNHTEALPAYWEYHSKHSPMGSTISKVSTEDEEPLSPTSSKREKRSSFIYKPIPEALQSLSAPPSNYAVVQRSNFDPKKGNYRPLGVSDWAGFVRKCQASGYVGAVPKVFYDDRLAFLSPEQNRLCVLLVLVKSYKFPFTSLASKDRFLLDEYWDSCGGRPQGLERSQREEKIMFYGDSN